MTSKNSATHNSTTNNKALGLRKLSNGSIELSAKNAKGGVSKTVFKAGQTPRKVALAVSKAAAGYRDDLIYPAVVRASALTRADKPKKVYPAKPARK